MNRVTIHEGYGIPFAAYRRKRRSAKRRSSGGPKRMQSRMKACALKWRKSKKNGKYTSFMKACLTK